MGVGKDRKGLGDNNVRAREDIGLIRKDKPRDFG